MRAAYYGFSSRYCRLRMSSVVAYCSLIVVMNENGLLRLLMCFKQ
jgi:hypothetical protein